MRLAMQAKALGSAGHLTRLAKDNVHKILTEMSSPVVEKSPLNTPRIDHNWGSNHDISLSITKLPLMN
jgi:hypothetical protein